MAFSRLQSDLRGRVRGKFDNLVVIFDELREEDGVEILIGRRYPGMEPLKVALSKTRTWRDRASLSETFAEVEPGCAVILYESEANGSTLEVRRVAPVNKIANGQGKVLYGTYARVGEPVKFDDSWVQAVQVLHADEAVLCLDINQTIAALEAALDRGKVGGPGFAIRAVDEEGVAVAVRFQRVWNSEAMAYVSVEESLEAFMTSNVMIQGLSDEVLGSEFLEILENQHGASWEVIPITSLNMRGAQVQAAGEGRGRNRAAPYRYNFARSETGTGFVPSVVAVDKAVGYYCKEAIPVSGGLAPLSLPYIKTANLQPVYKHPTEQAQIVEASPESVAAEKPKAAKRSRKSNDEKLVIETPETTIATAEEELTETTDEVVAQSMVPDSAPEEMSVEEVAQLEIVEDAVVDGPADAVEAGPEQFMDEEIDLRDLEDELNDLDVTTLTSLNDAPNLSSSM